jgi:hypothetical protein
MAPSTLKEYSIKVKDVEDCAEELQKAGKWGPIDTGFEHCLNKEDIKHQSLEEAGKDVIATVSVLLKVVSGNLLTEFHSIRHGDFQELYQKAENLVLRHISSCLSL